MNEGNINVRIISSKDVENLDKKKIKYVTLQDGTVAFINDNINSESNIYSPQRIIDISNSKSSEMKFSKSPDNKNHNFNSYNKFNQKNIIQQNENPKTFEPKKYIYEKKKVPKYTSR